MIDVKAIVGREIVCKHCGGIFKLEEGDLHLLEEAYANVVHIGWKLNCIICRKNKIIIKIDDIDVIE